MLSRMRYPLTLLLASLLVAVGLTSQSINHNLDVEWCRDWGSSPALLVGGHWHRLLTAILFTAGGDKFLASFVMLLLCVGAAERQFGTIRAAVVFLGTHIATLLLMLLIISETQRAGFTWGHSLYHACDVGPSAGYYGCLGWVVASCKPRLRYLLFAGIMAYLTARIYWSAQGMPATVQTCSADLAHLLAFPIGFLTASWRIVQPQARNSHGTPAA